MRKYLCVLISIILCLTVFCSCSNGKTANVAGGMGTSLVSSTSSEQMSDISKAAAESTLEAQSSKAEKEQSKKETTKKGGKASTTVKSSLKKDNKKNTEASKNSNSKSKSKSKSKAKAEKSESVSTTKSENAQAVVSSKSEHKVTQTSSSEINCSITIECKSILDNMDDLKKGHESYVPKNGIMLENYKTTLKSKSTVYDLLKKACNDKGLTYTAKTTAYSIYIVGINNIDEFDCGKQSGWMYTVNGVYPNVSADSKKLKDGDKVVFTYTCSYKK